MTQRDKQMFQQICGEQIQKPLAIWQSTAFLLNMILKGIPIGLYFFSGILFVIFSRTLVNELIVIFVVVEFWFTKNVIGRRLMGIRWYFGQDEYGRQKFMYECRANDAYVSFISSKLFWILQLVYILLPTVMIAAIILISPVLYQIDYGRVIILFIIFIGAVSNLFFFFRASLAASQKQYLLRERIGIDLLQKLGNASIHSHL